MKVKDSPCNVFYLFEIKGIYQVGMRRSLYLVHYVAADVLVASERLLQHSSTV